MDLPHNRHLQVSLRNSPKHLLISAQSLQIGQLVERRSAISEQILRTTCSADLLALAF